MKKKTIILSIGFVMLLSGCVRYSDGKPVEDPAASESATNKEANENEETTSEKQKESESSEEAATDASNDINVEAASVPDFDILEEDLNGAGIYKVTLATPSTEEAEIEALIKNTVSLAEEKKKEVNSINVVIRQENVDASNIATGRIALTKKGLAQTGFTEVPQIEINMILNNLVDTSQIQDSESSFTAKDVVQAFEKNDLSVPNPRDNTDKHCGDLPCSQLLTTDTVSIYQWESAEIAEEMLESGLGSYQAETFTIRFNEEVDEEAYKKALDKLVN